MVCHKWIAGLALAAVVAAASVPARAQVTQVSGAGLTNLGAPTNVTQGQHESDTNVFWFAEKQGVSVTSLFNDLSGGSPITGTVNSYMLYTDHVGTSGSQTYDITVDFTGKILGVITTAGHLDSTDSLLGLAGTTYPNGVADRGEDAGSDTVTLVNDHELKIHNVTLNSVNELRVLTAPIPEASTMIGFGIVFGLGGVGLHRLRKSRQSA